MIHLIINFINVLYDVAKLSIYYIIFGIKKRHKKMSDRNIYGIKFYMEYKIDFDHNFDHN